MPVYKCYVIEYFGENVNRIVARSMELDIALLLVKSLMEKYWEDGTVSYRIAREEQDDYRKRLSCSTKDDCLCFTNKDGCQWCDGVGTSPKGHYCGECDCINEETCYIREQEKREATVYDKETCSVREEEKKGDEKK